jgi:hypothetical protein
MFSGMAKMKSGPRESRKRKADAVDKLDRWTL